MLKLEFYRVSAVLWSTADNFDLPSSRCARLGVNYFSCMKNKKTATLAGFWNFACEHSSSTLQPIQSCHHPCFSHLSDSKDFSLASLRHTTWPSPLTGSFKVLLSTVLTPPSASSQSSLTDATSTRFQSTTNISNTFSFYLFGEMGGEVFEFD